VARLLPVLSVAAVLAGALAVPSLAADLLLPPPPVLEGDEVVELGNGWYLRGDVGAHWGTTTGSASTAGLINPVETALGSGLTAGVGVGIKSKWLRTDVTLDYALPVNYRGTQIATNEYTASKSEWVALVNAYIDLGTWWSITPFVGAGVGVAFNTIEHFRDNNIIAGGGGWADTGRQTNLAWALHAGASYRASQNFAVELSYRYLNVGNGRSGILQNLDPLFVSGNPLAPMTFHNIQSHDLMLGLRWLLQPEPMYSPALIRKG